MEAVVLYESVYGNTGAVARAVAEGLAPVGQVKEEDRARAWGAELAIGLTTARVSVGCLATQEGG